MVYIDIFPEVLKICLMLFDMLVITVELPYF